MMLANTDKLTIVMTTDKNYIVPTKVAIYSMLSSTPEAFLEIHVLCNENLDEDSRKVLCQVESSWDSRLKIYFDEVTDDVLSNAKTLGHIPVASYYRLYITRLLSGSRCLFLDGDIIVNTDLREIWRTDLDDYYIAAVRDCAVQSKNEAFAERELELEIPDMHQYVNAGVMLFNLDKIREDKLDEQLVEAIGRGYRYMDQDILNKFCYGRIKHLPLRFNLFAEFYERMEKMGSTDYTDDELCDVENWGILHYPGSYKPWVCSRLKANQIWWKVAKNVLTAEEYECWYTRALEQEKVSDWSYIMQHVEVADRVVVFGYSEIGRKVVAQLKVSKMDKPVVFADNDVNKQGIVFEGMKVLSAMDAVSQNGSALWIVSSQLSYVAITKQLIELGIPAEHIVRYVFKTEAYYEGLDEANYKYEMKILESN